MKYFEETKRFYYSIFFIMPFLAVYEYGLFKGVLGNTINGADALLRIFYYIINNIIGPDIMKFVVGAAIVGLISFLLYYFIKNGVRVKIRYFFFMAIESLALAFISSLIIHWSLSREMPKLFAFLPNESVVRQLSLIGLGSPWAKVVASVGAGIFEEFVFRVILIRLAYGLFRGEWNDFGKDSGALIKAVGASSLVFTLMHWGSVASIFGLVSIFLGSILFSMIYLKRGYGVAAGTHVFYDLFLMFGVIS